VDRPSAARGLALSERFQRPSRASRSMRANPPRLVVARRLRRGTPRENADSTPSARAPVGLRAEPLTRNQLRPSNANLGR